MSFGSITVIYSVARFFAIDPGSLFPSSQIVFNILAPLGHNIFWSLGTGLLFLYYLEKFRQSAEMRKAGYYAVLFALCAFSTLTEFSIQVIPLFLLFYFCHDQKTRLAVVYMLYCLPWLLSGLLHPDNIWHYEYQWMMVFALPMLLLYNGQRGSGKLKYFFYAVYPAHLWIIFFLEKYFLTE
jgi:hypothetical protein